MPPRPKRKTKTKVGSPEPSVPSIAQVASPTPDDLSVASVEPGLSWALQKQLAEDIEARGGIKKFIARSSKQKVRSLCESNTADYGTLGDPVRRQIANKIYKWKELYKKGLYEDRVINFLGVIRPQLITDVSGGGDSDESGSSLSSSGSDSEAGTITRSLSRAQDTGRTPIRQTTTQTQTPRHSQTRTTKHSQSQTPSRSSIEIPRFQLSLNDTEVRSEAMDRNCKTSHAIPSDAELIRVNTMCPERNGPVMVFPVNGLESVETNKVYPGFIIMFETDLRFAFDSQKDGVEYFSARVIAPNKLLIRLPSWPYCLFTDKDRSMLAAHLKPNFMNALDAKRNSFADNKEQRMWRHYLLEFEQHHQLSAKVIFKEAGDDDLLPSQIIPIKYTHPDMNGKTNSKHYMCMWVARTEAGAEQYGAYKNHTTMTASALAALGADGGF
jgi:hypothetical protein